MREFNYIVIDAVNLGYKVLSNLPDSDKFKSKNVLLSKKNIKKFIPVYYNFISRYIKSVDQLIDNYLIIQNNLKNIPLVYLLFDNYNSKDELFYEFKRLKNVNTKRKNLNYKKNREYNPIFFNSLNFIYYYYSNMDPLYCVCQASYLESDDLVKPCLDYIYENSTEEKNSIKILLVSSDSDWSVHISDTIYQLKFFNSPIILNKDLFFSQYKFLPEKINFYKLLAGDKADSIEKVLQLNDEEIIHIINTYDNFIDFFYENTVKNINNKYYTMLQENKFKLQSNFQLIEPVDVDKEKFKYNLIIGRDKKIITNSIRKLINM